MLEVRDQYAQSVEIGKEGKGVGLLMAVGKAAGRINGIK